jgi:ParB/RepB/Spo0J family partition protein
MPLLGQSPASRIQVDPEIANKFGLSIKEHGLIQTPVVRPGKEDGKYEIGDGWLRRAGFLCNLQEFGLQEYVKMPCVVRDLTDQQMADMVMEANTVRKDLNPIELAMFYKRYLEDFKVPQVELARRHNCSQGEIANTIRLLELPADIQEKIISQEISETHGRQLLRLNYNTELQQSILKETVEKGISVNELSNRIASQMYWSSEDMDPGSYRKPIFDTKECESCPNHQKIGDPYDSKKKSWRCLDKACYKRKEDQVEKERVDKLAAEIAVARAEADKGKGKGKGKKGEAAIIDCTSNKLTWRDYQELGKEYHNIDNPEQCKTCIHRVLGAFYNGKTRPICVNVKCFKEKEKAYAAKEAVKTREAEHQLTEQVKAVCDKVNDETILFKVITDYLLAHCRKDTRERFAKMYGITDIKLFLAEYFASSDRANVLQKLAALVLQMERYEGEKGMFKKMLAYLDGTGAEVEKQIATFRETHCKGCRNDKDDGGCRVLMRVYTEGKCYAYWKSKEEVQKETDNDTTKANKSENQVLKDSLPCKDCQNEPTCQRTFFYADGQGGLTCDNKVSAGAQEEVPSEV